MDQCLCTVHANISNFMYMCVKDLHVCKSLYGAYAAAPVVPVVISVGTNPDHYITEDRVVNGTNGTTIVSG